jgi:pantothenate kinase
LEELENVHQKVLGALIKAAANFPKERYLVILAGPSGSGKSTLGALWEKLVAKIDPSIPIQVLPMDGFHFPNSYLDSHYKFHDGKEIPLRQIKGSPESYNLAALKEALQKLRTGEEISWPYYSRDLHDPIHNAIKVNAHGIVIIEGNYLLLDEPGWRDLRKISNRCVFVDTDESTAHSNVVSRHIQGGRTKEDAEAYYHYSDEHNNERIRQHFNPVDSDILLFRCKDWTLIRG